MPKPTKAEIIEAYGQELNNNVLLEERLAELELALEDRDWLKLSLSGEREFSRDGLAKIIQLSRMMMLKNPLINHAGDVTQHYVFGQGVEVRYEDERLNDVWQAFWDDPKNQVELTSPEAMFAKERELEETGNLFLTAFTNISSGRVRLRSIPIEDIRGIITDPEDSKQPWYYHRVWTQRVIDSRFTQHDAQRTTERQAYYPAMGYYPAGADRRTEIGGHPVMWDSPVYHTKIGGSALMKFGVPEFYAALDWARAVKEQLEDFATTHRALARFAWSLTAKGGSKAVAAAKTKLGTTLGLATGSGAETNPPPGVASTFISTEGVDMKPIQTRGMAPPPDEGRMLGLMVAAATGIPYTILYGDADVGNLATAKTLDRPTELKMLARQIHWTGTFRAISSYVMLQAVSAASGPLHTLGNVAADPEDASRTLVWTPAAEVDPLLHVDWPELLERDVSALVTAIVQAVTLDGKPRSELFDDELVIRLLLAALGEDDIDEILAARDGNTGAAEAKFGKALVAMQEMVEASRNGRTK